MGKRYDITGRRFGRLKAIKWAGKKGRKNLWLCQCDCGNQKAIRLAYLTEGHSTSCGCLRKEALQKQADSIRIELNPGELFGQLRVIKPLGTIKKHFMYLCKCFCGVVKPVRGERLVNGVTRSCGCLSEGQKHPEKHAASMSRPRDLTGEKFHHLRVIEKTHHRANGSVVWKCQCVCGAIKFASRNHLVTGNTKSCGCLRRQKKRDHSWLDESVFESIMTPQ